MPVFRVVATVVAVAMLSISGSAALQHVHAYADHDHADHHHAPASHSHTRVMHQHHPDSHVPDDAVRLEGCDPGEHAVSVVFTYVAPQPDHPPVLVTLETVIVRPPEQVWCHVAPSDVRAHGPPRLTGAPLRGPPIVHPA